MTITALPTPPSRDDPANFASRADTFLAALPDFATEANALASAVNADEIAAAASASSASTSASNASASASAASTSASNASTSATNASNSATAAANSATAAANSATALIGTSTTSLSIGTGSKTFTTQSGKQFVAGAYILAVSSANAANYMFGQVTSYSSTSLVIDVQVVGGSGTYASWNLTLSGVRGVAGPVGGVIGQTDSVFPPGNTFIGYDAGALTTASGNTFIGYSTGSSNIGGSANTAIGLESFLANISGSNNTAYGFTSLTSATTAVNNIAIGYSALQFATTGSNNTAVGVSALDGISTGGFNIGIGPNAGLNIDTGSENICIGNSTEISSTNGTNQIVIGRSITGSGNSTVTIGSNSGKIYNAYTVNATWTQTSDGTMKNIIGHDDLGLSFIKRLNPIKFTWKPQNQLPKDHPYYAEKNEKDTQTVIHGFIAQEVKAALDAEGCSTFNGWDQGPDGIQAISREMFISPLVKAVQELAARVEALESQLKDDQRG